MDCSIRFVASASANIFEHIIVMYIVRAGYRYILGQLSECALGGVRSERILRYCSCDVTSESPRIAVTICLTI